MTVPNEEQLAEWTQWLEGRPEAVRLVAERYPPWLYYRLTTTGQLGQILAYGEPEKEGEPVTVRMLLCLQGAGTLAPLMTRQVFGIDPATLEETDVEPDYVAQAKAQPEREKWIEL